MFGFHFEGLFISFLFFGSSPVRRRFPTLDHIEEVGLFTAEERAAYDEIIGTHGKWWVSRRIRRFFEIEIVLIKRFSPRSQLNGLSR